MSPRSFFFLSLGVVLVASLSQCGGGASAPTTQPSVPTTTTTTTAPPSAGNLLPAGMVCDPTPPPLYRMQAKIHGFGGYRNVLDSKPVVWNVDNYCDRVGIGSGKFCDTRPEGDLQRVACDYLATGKALDTGRWGPTWFYNGIPCAQEGEHVGCSNHPDGQFMAIGKGDGEYAACASPDVPMIPDGSRCGVCKVIAAQGDTCQ